jgi:hypothetical protein
MLNSPVSAWWFSNEEKDVAVERLRMGQMGIRCQKVKWLQTWESILDPKVWIIAIMMGKLWGLNKFFGVISSDTIQTDAAYIVNGDVSSFGPLIVTTFSWNAYQSLLWQMPLGAVCFVTILLTSYLSLRIPNIRLLMLVSCCLPVTAGRVMIWRSTWTHHAVTPLASYTLLNFLRPSPH